MDRNRCAARCGGCRGLSRREFVAGTSAAWVSTSLLGGAFSSASAAPAGKIEPAGPASRCTPTVKAAFVRRKGEYGMLWPGQVYDGEAARAKYSQQLAATAKELRLRLDLRSEPLYSLEESAAWLAEAAAARPDGLLLVLLDRQAHTWPTAERAIATKIPTVIFSPVGSSFTTNTAGPSQKPGCFIASTDDFRQVRWGLKMLGAGAKIRSTRCLVIAGSQAADAVMPHLGLQLRTIPAKTFLDEYRRTPENDEVLTLAEDLIRGAKRLIRATRQDVINGIKSYVVARKLLVRQQADAITMDCLGALGHTKVSLPCIAWSKMNDDGIPAACEADLGAMATHVLVQYLFDRPGFQQDPVAETSREAILGAHCCCPLKLGGFAAPPEPYDILPHHGLRDATARPVWRVGQRVTSADFLPPAGKEPAKLIVSAGTVLENVSVPPAGGCVVSVMVKFDNVSDVLAYPGFHQIFFYGDSKRELVQFCRLFNIEPIVV